MIVAMNLMEHIFTIFAMDEKNVYVVIKAGMIYKGVEQSYQYPSVTNQCPAELSYLTFRKKCLCSSFG